MSACDGLPIGPSQTRARALDLRAPLGQEGIVDLRRKDFEYGTGGSKEQIAAREAP